MLFKNVLAKVKDKTASFDGKSYGGFLAVQVTLTDLNEVFYVEIKNGALSIEPYEYNDRQAHISMKSNDFSKLLDRKLDPAAAAATGKLKVEGDAGKALELAGLFK